MCVSVTGAACPLCLGAGQPTKAQQLVNAMAGDFDAAQYHDEYREALMKVIQAKIDGQPVEAPEPVAEVGRVTDLMAVLEASVAAAREAREAVDGKAASGGKSKEPTSVAEARASRSRAKTKAADEDAAKPAASARTERKRKTA